MQIFSENWLIQEDVSEDEFEFTKEGLDMFSSNTFNIMDIVGEDMKDHIDVSVTETEGAVKKLPLGLQSNFKIGLYGSNALHYKLGEKNQNQNAQEKQKLIRDQGVSNSSESIAHE